METSKKSLRTYDMTADLAYLVVGILACYARGRGIDSRTVQTYVCMNMPACVGSECFYYKMYVFTEKNAYKYVLIRYLESITQAL
jgi:hypothetical protein